MLSNALLRLANVRPDEGRRVGRMFALLGLIIATSYILKPVRSSLFLSQFGSERLPYVYMLVAAVLGVVAGVFARWGREVNLTSLFTVASYVFSSSFLLFWVATVTEQPWTGFAFYVWVSVYTALMPSLFWLLANYVFYSNEGRRLFPVVIAGGLLGSIIGGGLTSLAVRFVGTAALLLVAAVLLLGIAALVRSNTSRERSRMAERRADLGRQERSRSVGNRERPLRLILGSRYLAMLTALILLTSLTSTLVDYQFNTVVERSFETRDALTGFFGTFFAVINVLAFALQLLLAGRLLSRLGVGAGLSILPLALVGSSVSFLAFPALVTASLVKTADDGLSNSVNRASVEVLYLPVSLAVKNRLKAWLDMFVERVSRGLGGVTILLATSVLSLSVAQISVVVIALLIPWILLVVLLEREYVNTFRDSLARRDISDFGSMLRDQASRSLFHQLLSGSDERELLYVLELLQGIDDPELIRDVTRLTRHPSPMVRRASLRLLRTTPDPPVLEDLADRSRDPDDEVAGEALALWIRTEPETGREAFDRVVVSGDADRIETILSCLEGSEESVSSEAIETIVAQHSSLDDAASRKLAARGVGFLPEGSPVIAHLSRLLNDPEIEVARAAAASAGKLRDSSHFPLLISQLRRRPLRAVARRAIARFGPEAVGDLVRLLRDEGQDRDLRLALPLALAEHESQSAVDALLEFLPEADPRLHYQAVKGLSKLRSRFTSLRFPRRRVDRLLEHERHTLSELSRLLAGVGNGSYERESHRLLSKVLEERVDFARERIFRLLALRYPREEIYSAWGRIVNGRPAVRAAALEYLANVFSREHRERLLPLLETDDRQAVRSRASEPMEASTPTLENALSRLLREDDEWLAACAATVIGDLELASLEKELTGASRRPSALVRESVEHALRLVATG